MSSPQNWVGICVTFIMHLIISRIVRFIFSFTTLCLGVLGTCSAKIVKYCVKFTTIKYWKYEKELLHKRVFSFILRFIFTWVHALASWMQVVFMLWPRGCTLFTNLSFTFPPLALDGFKLNKVQKTEQRTWKIANYRFYKKKPMSSQIGTDWTWLPIYLFFFFFSSFYSHTWLPRFLYSFTTYLGWFY